MLDFFTCVIISLTTSFSLIVLAIGSSHRLKKISFPRVCKILIFRCILAWIGSEMLTFSDTSFQSNPRVTNYRIEIWKLSCPKPQKIWRKVNQFGCTELSKTCQKSMELNMLILSTLKMLFPKAMLLRKKIMNIPKLLWSLLKKPLYDDTQVLKYKSFKTCRFLVSLDLKFFRICIRCHTDKTC